MLRTERLSLRPLRIQDANDIFAYASDPEVSRYTTWETHPNLDVSLGYIHYVQSRYLDGLPDTWGIILNSTDHLVGTVGLLNFEEQAKHIELGYVVAPQHQSQGIATEAANLAMDYAFGPLGLNKVSACCFAENHASERVMLKLGMRYEGTVRDHIWKRGSLHDVKLYGKLAKECGAS